MIPPFLATQFDMIDEIPSGKIVRCFHMKSRNDGLEYLFRFLPKELCTPQNVAAFESFFRKYRLINRVGYRIPGCEYSETHGTVVYAGEEFAVGTSLADYAREVSTEQDNINIIEILYDACEALHFAHQGQVYHLCITPNDIIIDFGANKNSQPKVKLVGFGSEIFCGSELKNRISPWCRRFMAPEIFSRGAWDSRSDVFSLAKTVAEIFPDVEDHAILRKCLDANPEARPSDPRLLRDEITQLLDEWSRKPSAPAERSHPVLKMLLKINPIGAVVKTAAGKVVGVAKNDGLLVTWKQGIVLHVEKEGFRTRVLDLEKPPDDAEIAIDLETTKLKLRTNPAGAEVCKNGRAIGTTPLEIAWTEGPFTVRKRGYTAAQLSFSEPPVSDEVFVELKRKSLPFPSKPQMKIVGVVVAILVAFAVAVPRIAQMMQKLELTIVTEPANVSVFVDDGATPVGVSDSKGILTIPFRRSGERRLTFRHDYFETQDRKYVVVDNRLRDNMHIALKRTKCDMRVNTNLGNVLVKIGDLQGTTDPTGKLVLKGVPIQTPLEVVFQKQDYHDLRRQVTIPNATDVYTLQFVSLKPLQGTLLLAVGEPDTEVYVKKTTDFVFVGKTDSRGNYPVDKLPLRSPISVRLAKQGWDEKTIGPFEFTADQLTIQQTAVMDKALGSVEFQTIPPDVTVKVDSNIIGKTDNNGLLPQNGLQVGVPLGLEFEKEGYDAEKISLTIPASFKGKQYKADKVTLALAVKSDSKGPRSEGKLMELALKTNTPDAQVFVGDDEMPIGVTDASGVLRLPFKRFGKIDLHVRKEDYDPFSQPININADTIAKGKDINLKRLRTTIVIKTDPGEVDVKLGGGAMHKTDKDGNLTIPGVPTEKSITLLFSKDGYNDERRQPKIPAEEQYVLDKITLTERTSPHPKPTTERPSRPEEPAVVEPRTVRRDPPPVSEPEQVKPDVRFPRLDGGQRRW